jgi:hypothetical protein
MEDGKAPEQKEVLTVAQKIEEVKNTPEFAAILNQHGKTYHEMKAEETGGSFMGKAYNNVDNALMEELGLKERPTGKTTELVRQLAKEKKELESKLSKLQVEPKEDKTEANKLYESQITALQNQLAETAAAKTALEIASKQQKIENNFSKALTDITFNPTYGKALLDETISNRTKKVVQNSKEIEGRTVFYKDNGEPYTNLNGLPMIATEVANEVFKDLVHVQKKGGNAQKENTTVVKGDIVVMPTHQNINSFAEFNAEFAKAMRSKGLTRKDEKCYELQRATSKHYKFGDLPSE